MSGLISKAKEIVIEDNVKAEWLGLSQATALLNGNTLPYSWDTSSYIGQSALSQVINRFDGLEAKVKSGSLADSTITIKDISLEPHIGSLEATFTLVGKAAHFDFSIQIKAHAIARFVGIKHKDPKDPKSPMETFFQWAPLSVQPGASLGGTGLKADGFASKMLAEAVQLFANSYLQFSVPIQQDITGKVDPIQQFQTQPAGDSGTVSWEETMPPYEAKQSLNAAPIFTQNGIWIVANFTDTDGPLVNAPPVPDEPVGQLEAEIATMRTKLEPILKAAEPPAGANVRVFINSRFFDRLFKIISDAPQENRTLSFKLCSHTGQLAEADSHNDVLGSIAAWAEIASDNDCFGSAKFDPLQGKWTHDGLDVSDTVHVHAEASVHVQIELKALGPVFKIGSIEASCGTVVGLVGDTSPTLALHGTPKILTDPASGISIAALVIRGQGVQVPITVTTNGQAAVQFGWFSVPKVGVKFDVPAFGSPQEPSTLIGDKPFLESILPPENDTFSFTHASPYAELSVTPISVAPSDQGLMVDASIQLKGLPMPDTPAGHQAAEDLVNQDAAASSVIAKNLVAAELKTELGGNLPKADKTELIIDLGAGSIKIGPDNDVVKFIANAINDLTSGPGQSNDLVRVGYYLGSILKVSTGNVITPITDGVRNQLKSLVPADSPVMKTCDYVTNEMQAFQDNPLKAAITLPKDQLNYIGDMGKQALAPFTSTNPTDITTIANAFPGVQVAPTGPNGTTVSIGPPAGVPGPTVTTDSHGASADVPTPFGNLHGHIGF